MSASRPKPIEYWTSLADERIRDAIDAGQFDDLPRMPLDVDDADDADEDWWLKEKLRREKLSALPPGLAIRAEVHRVLASLSQTRHETQVRPAVRQLNVKIREAMYEVRPGPPSTTMPLDEDQVVQRWRSGELDAPRRWQ